MVKSNAERQREFRAKAKGKFRKLEVLLPCNEFSLLSGNAKKQGLTKANYVLTLLHDNGIVLTGNNIANQDKGLAGLQGAVEELEAERLAMKKQLKAGAGDREAKQALDRRVIELTKQLKESEGLRTDEELRRYCNELVKEIARLRKGQNPESKQGDKQSSDNDGYDGNAEGFRGAVERVTGISQNDRSKFANKLKSTYAAVGITPKKNGRLSSDTERMAVIEWLRDNHN